MMMDTSKLVIVVPSSDSDRCTSGASDNESGASDTAILVSTEDMEREMSTTFAARGSFTEPLTPKGCKSKFRRNKVPPAGQYPNNFCPYQMNPRQLHFNALPRCHARYIIYQHVCASNCFLIRKHCVSAEMTSRRLLKALRSNSNRNISRKAMSMQLQTQLSANHVPVVLPSAEGSDDQGN